MHVFVREGLGSPRYSKPEPEQAVQRSRCFRFLCAAWILNTEVNARHGNLESNAADRLDGCWSCVWYLRGDRAHDCRLLRATRVDDIS